MENQTITKIRNYCKIKAKSNEDLTAKTVLGFTYETHDLFLTAAELKEMTKDVIKNSNTLTVDKLVDLLGLSRQRIYQALSPDGKNALSGLDICQRIMEIGGYEIKVTDVTVVRAG